MTTAIMTTAIMTTAIMTTAIMTTAIMTTANETMSDSDSGTGIIISIVYGTCHLILLLILCIKMYHNSMKANDKISIRKFAWSLWKQRGIYSPVIIHIYDTATDIGVLYEWYKLAQMEKNGERELKSLDMEQFFW
eukprot:763255_1